MNLGGDRSAGPFLRAHRRVFLVEFQVREHGRSSSIWTVARPRLSRGVNEMFWYRRMSLFSVLAAVLLSGCGDDDSSGPGPIDDGLPDDPAPGQIQTWAGTGFIGFNGDGKKLLQSSF